MYVFLYKIQNKVERGYHNIGEGLYLRGKWFFSAQSGPEDERKGLIQGIPGFVERVDSSSAVNRVIPGGYSS